MPIDPDMLPNSSRGEVILESRPCTRCGYELKGLKLGGVCPECGAAIRRGRGKRFADNLTDAPIGYLSLLTIGLGIMASVVALGTVTAIYAAFRSANFAPVPTLALHIIAFGLACGWAVGIGIVTMKRPLTDSITRDYILESVHIRSAARIATLFPVLAIPLSFTTVATGFWIFGVLTGLVGLGGLYGVVPLCVYLSSLSDWAGDTVTGDRLRGSAWAIAVCGTITLIAAIGLMLNLQLAVIPLLFSGFTSFATIVALVTLVLCVIQLAQTSMWAMHNSKSAAEREIRIAERRRQEDAERDAVVQANIERAKAGKPDPRFRRPDPEDDEPLPLADLEEERDEIDEALGFGQGPDLRARNAWDEPGRPADDIEGETRRKFLGPNIVDPPSDDSGGYDLEPEDD